MTMESASQVEWSRTTFLGFTAQCPYRLGHAPVVPLIYSCSLATVLVRAERQRLSCWNRTNDARFADECVNHFANDRLFCILDESMTVRTKQIALCDLVENFLLSIEPSATAKTKQLFLRVSMVPIENEGRIRDVASVTWTILQRL